MDEIDKLIDAIVYAARRVNRSSYWLTNDLMVIELNKARAALRAAVAEKDAEIEELKASLANLYHSYGVAVADVKKKDAEIARLKDVIKSVEWSYRDDEGDYCCPSCYGYKEPTNAVRETPGHTQSCKIRNALA